MQPQSRANPWVGVVAFLAVLAFLGWLLGWLFSPFVQWVASKEFGGQLLLVLGGAGGAIVTNYFTKLQESRLRLEQARREQKIVVYRDFLELMFEIIQGGQESKKQKKEGLSEDQLDRLRVQVPRMLMWAPDPVLKAYSEWFKAVYSRVHLGGDEEAADLLLLFERLLFEIRKDVGYINAGLRTCDLLGVFVTDIQKLGGDKCGKEVH